MNEILKSLL